MYNFFDDTYTFRRNGYHGQDKMSPKQFIVMGTLFVLIVIISILLRRVKKEKIFTMYKLLSIVMIALEIFKISFSTYFDVTVDHAVNWGGALPLYTCSMLLYFLPIVAWGKGKLQQYSMAFFTNIGIIAGLSNFIYLSAAGFYPIFSFGGMYSVVFHGVLVFVGMSLMITGIYQPRVEAIAEGMIPVFLFSVIVIPANFIIKNFTDNGWVDYMMLMDANGFSPFADWANFLGSHHLRLLFSLFMLLVMYPICSILLTSLEIGIMKIISKIRGNKKESTNELAAE